MPNNKETPLQTMERHLNEMRSEIEGWNREMENAYKRGNVEFLDYCRTRISVCMNTIDRLEKDLDAVKKANE